MPQYESSRLLISKCYTFFYYNSSAKDRQKIVKNHLPTYTWFLRYVHLILWYQVFHYRVLGWFERYQLTGRWEAPTRNVLVVNDCLVSPDTNEGSNWGRTPAPYMHRTRRISNNTHFSPLNQWRSEWVNDVWDERHLDLTHESQNTVCESSPSNFAWASICVWGIFVPDVFLTIWINIKNSATKILKNFLVLSQNLLLT